MAHQPDVPLYGLVPAPPLGLVLEVEIKKLAARGIGDDAVGGHVPAPHLKGERLGRRVRGLGVDQLVA